MKKVTLKGVCVFDGVTDADGVRDGVGAAEPVWLLVPEPLTVGVRVGDAVRDAP